MKIAIAQLNPCVGDIKGNLKLALSAVDEAEKNKASLLVFPEMFLTGYPPEDLLFRRSFLVECASALKRFSRGVKGKRVAVVMGLPWQDGDGLYNSAAFIRDGRVIDVYFKGLLPNYGVFDEKRYFLEGKRKCIWQVGTMRFAPTICEDLWDPDSGIVPNLKNESLDFVVNLSASPFHMGKMRQRLNVLKKASKRLGAPVVYVNLIGGQDELIFDGGSMVISSSGLVSFIPQFKEGVFYTSMPVSGRLITPRFPRREEEAFYALVMGVRDYTRKNGFSKVIVGLSGGIDSALTAAIAVEALGRESVVGVSMPSRFNSQQTQDDVRRLSENLGIDCYWIPIDDIFSQFLNALHPLFKETEFDKAEENIQARIRGTILMAISNKFGWLVLTTGNKSEMSVGYATLYGDMAGGFGVLKDVPKTLVWRLARFYNRLKKREVIPNSIIRRPPSAELRLDQRDEDALGSYSILDRVIDMYVEEHRPVDEIISTGIDPDYVRRVVRMIDRAEYKRRQAPPGIKITPLAFGRDWRMPITKALD